MEREKHYNQTAKFQSTTKGTFYKSSEITLLVNGIVFIFFVMFAFAGGFDD